MGNVYQNKFKKPNKQYCGRPTTSHLEHSYQDKVNYQIQSVLKLRILKVPNPNIRVPRQNSIFQYPCHSRHVANTAYNYVYFAMFLE